MKNVLVHVLPKWQPRMKFGFEALSTRPLMSLNANARVLVSNRKTAESKIYRLTHTAYLLRLFPELLFLLHLVREQDYVNVDFSNFHGRQTLFFSRQTREGRAIPVFFDFLLYPVRRGSQNTFIKTTLEQFLKCVRVFPRLVFDRGFAIPALVHFLLQNKVIFYIRIKRRKSILFQGRSYLVGELKEEDVHGIIYEHLLRVVHSKKARRWKEPWYIVTNDMSQSSKEILNIYYHRFEIEETFKDLKWLEDLVFLRTVRNQTFRIVLWFLCLGTWIPWQTKPIRSTWRRVNQATNPHQRLSLPRFFLEGLLRERNALARRFVR